MAQITIQKEDWGKFNQSYNVSDHYWEQIDLIAKLIIATDKTHFLKFPNQMHTLEETIGKFSNNVFKHLLNGEQSYHIATGNIIVFGSFEDEDSIVIKFLIDI